MGMPKQRQAGFTRSDWQDWEGRWELLDGVAYDMTPAPSVEHQSMVADIYFSMRESLEESKKKCGGRCRVFFAPNTFRGDRLDALDQPVTHSVFEEARPKSPLAPAKKSGEAILFGLDVFLAENVLQPDILVVCDPEKVHDHGIEGAPDVVVEVLSPRTAFKDMNHKRRIYEVAGVPEYLIIDPLEKAASLFLLREGHYIETLDFNLGDTIPLLGGRLPVIFRQG